VPWKSNPRRSVNPLSIIILIAEFKRLDAFRHGLSVPDLDDDVDSTGIETFDSYPCGSVRSSVWERELPCCGRW
jgi:hypothetical protein